MRYLHLLPFTICVCCLLCINFTFYFCLCQPVVQDILYSHRWSCAVSYSSQTDRRCQKSLHCLVLLRGDKVSQRHLSWQLRRDQTWGSVFSFSVSRHNHEVMNAYHLCGVYRRWWGYRCHMPYMLFQTFLQQNAFKALLTCALPWALSISDSSLLHGPGDKSWKLPECPMAPFRLSPAKCVRINQLL